MFILVAGELLLPHLSGFVTRDFFSCFRVSVALAGLSVQRELLKGSTSEKLADLFR